MVECAIEIKNDGLYVISYLHDTLVGLNCSCYSSFLAYFASLLTSILSLMTTVIHGIGMVDNVLEYLKVTHCTVLPTYYPEGMSNVLLESCASGRPIITTDRPGCGEIVDDGVNGFVVKAKDAKDLVSKMTAFIKLPYERKKEMGLEARSKVEKQFNRSIVVGKYLEAINRICRRL